MKFTSKNRCTWFDNSSQKRTRHQFLEAGYGQTGVDIARGMVIVNVA